MAPKPRTKAEEALQFLDDLDFSVDDVPSSPPPESAAPSATSSTLSPSNPAPVTSASSRVSSEAGRRSVDSTRKSAEGAGRKSLEAAREKESDPVAEVGKDAEDALKFLDDLTLKSSTPTRPLSVPPSAPAQPRAPSPLKQAPSPTPSPAPPQQPLNVPSPSPAPAASSVGGWGSLWSSASKTLESARLAAVAIQAEGTKAVSGAIGEVVQDTRRGIEVQTAEGGAAEPQTGAGGAGGWGLGGLKLDQLKGLDIGGIRGGLEERLKGVDLAKLRQSLVDQTSALLSTIAPPIAAHELIEVHLAHPMTGYEGVEGVVYRAFGRVLERVEGGELVVVEEKLGKEERRNERSLGTVEGWEEGLKRAQALLDQMIAENSTKPVQPSSSSAPVSVTPIFLSIQPVLTPLPFAEPCISPSSSPSTSSPAPSAQAASHLSFLLILSDPSHSLIHSTSSQPLPGRWLSVKYEENDWVEEAMVGSLKGAVEVLGGDYVGGRMAAFGEEEEQDREGTEGQQVKEKA